VDRFTTVPNVLTLSRLAAAPLLLLLAAADASAAFLTLLAYALLSDVIDGPIARRWGQASSRGATLDSWADCALYLTVPWGVLLLKPWVAATETASVMVVIGGYVLPITSGALKFGRLTAYHTAAAKVSGTALALSGIGLLTTGHTWPLRVAAVLLAISAAEEIAITWVLPHWRANVPSLLSALRLSRSGD
jgi:phosphatidylglycerophosphate synthase